jgi:hypothetical protein
VICFFGVYRCEPEATFDIPAAEPGQPPLTIAIGAAGGGTVGRRYARQDWIYAVHLDSTLVISGTDLHSGTIAHTHLQMAAILAACLAGSGEVPLVLAAQQDRLSCWATNTDNETDNEED